MNKSTTIIETLKKEATACFNMVELAINNMEDENWGKMENEWSYASTLYHIIETFEFYIHDSDKGMKEAGELGIKTTNIADDEIQAKINIQKKSFFLEYLEKVKELVFSKLSSYTDQNLYEKDDFSKWGFTSRFYKYSYVLRHTMFHTGEINKFLRDSKRTRLKWL